MSGSDIFEVTWREFFATFWILNVAHGEYEYAVDGSVVDKQYDVDGKSWRYGSSISILKHHGTRMMRTSERHAHREPTREVKLHHQHTHGTRAWRTHDFCSSHMELATILRIAHAVVVWASLTAYVALSSQPLRRWRVHHRP